MSIGTKASDYILQMINKIKDTAIYDIDERLAIAKMNVASTRAMLLKATDGKSLIMYSKKLQSAQKEYEKLQKAARGRKRIV